MKTPITYHHSPITFLVLLFLSTTQLLNPSTALAQGPLTPPGPPGPTMKTLDQVEPRTPLSSGAPGVTVNANGGFTITAPGSYYLTKNLTVANGNGIEIGSDNVTVDLHGFTISSTASPAAGTGIRLLDGTQAPQNIAIQNGHIGGGTDINSGAGFQTGIARGGFTPRGARITDISVVGTSGSGIALGFSQYDVSGIVVDRCSVELAGGTGILGGTVSNSVASFCNYGIIAATVTNCAVTNSNASGIRGQTIVNCSVQHSLGDEGILADTISGCTASYNTKLGLSGATVINSTAINNYGIGILGRFVTNCTATLNKTHGIQVTGFAKDNQASGNGINGNGAGIYFTTDGVRIEGNNCFDNDWGIQGIANTDSFIVRNSCRSNGTAPANGGASGDYDFPSSNTFGPIIQVSGDMAANAPASSHSWANFRY